LNEKEASMKSITVFLACATMACAAMAKLPAPSDEAKAKTAEAAAKAAHTGKVDNYLLCKYQDKSAAHYYKTAKASRKETQAPVATAPCADPGAFTYVPAGAAVATAAPAAAAPAAVAAAKDKKKP
jgi:hypothetical protein